MATWSALLLIITMIIAIIMNKIQKDDDFNNMLTFLLIITIVGYIQTFYFREMVAIVLLSFSLRKISRGLIRENCSNIARISKTPKQTPKKFLCEI